MADPRVSVTVFSEREHLRVDHDSNENWPFNLRIGDFLESRTTVILAFDRPTLEHLRDLIIAELAAEEAERTGLCQVREPGLYTICGKPIVEGTYVCAAHGGNLKDDDEPIPFDRAKMAAAAVDGSADYARDPAPLGRCYIRLDNGDLCDEPVDIYGTGECAYHRAKRGRAERGVPDVL